MDEPLITQLQNLQNTPIPTLFAGAGCILIITSLVGTVWRHSIPPERRKSIGCFGTLFLFFSILLYEGSHLLHSYTPTITIGETFTAISQFFTLFLQGLRDTPLPPILAGAGSIILIMGIVGIFNERKLSRQQQIYVVCFGIFFLVISIFLYETPVFMPNDVNAGNSSVESLKVFFNGGDKGITTKASYKDIAVVTIKGEAKISDTSFADAFYSYDHSESKPSHRLDYTVRINGKPVDEWLKPIPSYRKDHVYTFKINAPEKNLSFSVGKEFATDKNGFFLLYISEEN